MGGNNALLFACANTSNVDQVQSHDNQSDEDDSSSEIEQANYMLVKYLIDEAGADPNVQNDTF